MGEKYRSSVLFENLRKDGTRAAFINQLRGTARVMMRQWEQRLPTVQEALRVLPEAERQGLFQQTFRNAMPWVNADLGKDPDFEPAMVSTFVVVENGHDFLDEFGDEIRAVQDARFQGRFYPYPVASGERGRLVVYTEYSGMPLNVLTGLHKDWKRAYKSLSSRHFPLHNHWRSERFQRPTAMEAGELRRVHDNLKLFLKGVALGVLRRQRGGEGCYEINVGSSSAPEWQGIGSELQIYGSGFSPDTEGPLRQQVEAKEEVMRLRQKLLVAALFCYLAKRSYAPIMVRNSRGEGDREGGIAHHAAKALHAEYVRWFEEDNSREDLPGETRDLLAAAYASREKWSNLIEGSLNDTTAREANLNLEEDDEYKKAQPKRWIDLESLTDTQIDEWLGLSRGEADSATESREEPPEPASDSSTQDTVYLIVLDGRPYRPMSRDEIREMYSSGKITGETLIWRQGLAEWVRCRELDDLADLFGESQGFLQSPLQ